MANNSDVEVIINGVAYEGWKSFTIKNEYEKPTGELSLSMSERPGNPLPAFVGDEIQLKLAGKSVLKGNIKSLEGSHDYDSHDINIKARDATNDMVQSKVGPITDPPGPITLENYSNYVLSETGLNMTIIDDTIGTMSKIPFKDGEVPASDIHKTIFDTIEKLARKRSAIVNTDGEGNPKLSQNKNIISSYPLHFGKEDDPENNVLRSSFKTDDHTRFNQNNVAAQKSSGDIAKWESTSKSDIAASADAMSKNTAVAFDTGVRPSLRNFERSQVGSEGQTPEQAAKWRANINRSRSFTYTATVQGFTQGEGGEVWWPGLSIPVYDYAWLITEVLFLKAVTFKKDWDGGATTELDMTYEDAFKPEAEQKASKTRSSKQGLIGTKPKGSYEMSKIPEQSLNYSPIPGKSKIQSTF